MNKRMKKLFTKLGVVLAITTIASTSVLANENEDLSENDTLEVDCLLAYHALQDRKPIKALETFEEHWGAFDINMSQEGKTYFTIAGLAHFTPDTGVLTRLEEKSYKIERIK